MGPEFWNCTHTRGTHGCDTVEAPILVLHPRCDHSGHLLSSYIPHMKHVIKQWVGVLRYLGHVPWSLSVWKWILADWRWLNLCLWRHWLHCGWLPGDCGGKAWGATLAWSLWELWRRMWSHYFSVFWWTATASHILHAQSTICDVNCRKSYIDMSLWNEPTSTGHVDLG